MAGEDIAGKTILLHAEQGFGDTIQFVRYVPLVAAKGASVVLEVPDSLKPLLDGFDGVSAIMAPAQPLPPFDLHCPLLSLPLAFGTTLATIPAERVPICARRPSACAEMASGCPAADRPARRHGLVRQTDAQERPQPQHRLVPPGAAACRCPASNSSACSSEYPRCRPRARCETIRSLLRLDRKLADFADTAAAVAALDLVITVDTAVAHLAGAHGQAGLDPAARTCWIGAGCSERADSPWYPTRAAVPAAGRSATGTA